jgi:hypothetical protein
MAQPTAQQQPPRNPSLVDRAVHAYSVASAYNATNSQNNALLTLELFKHAGMCGDLRDRLAFVLAQHAANAAYLGDKTIAAATDAEPFGITLADDAHDRSAVAIATILPVDDYPDEDEFSAHLDDVDAVTTRVERLAGSEPLQTGADAMHEAMNESDAVIGWRRKVHPDCCAMCQRLDTGEVFPTETRMIRHPNDRCIAEPAVIHQHDTSEEGSPA